MIGESMREKRREKGLLRSWEGEEGSSRLSYGRGANVA